MKWPKDEIHTLADAGKLFSANKDLNEKILKRHQKITEEQRKRREDEGLSALATDLLIDHNVTGN